MNRLNGNIVILGGGIGGLSAAYELLKSRKKVLIVEKDKELGGLMRAIKHGDYNLDLGHKQFYSRIPIVHSFYNEILGDKFRSYQHRIGVYYKNRIYERDRKYKGLFRGMPILLISKGMIDLIFQKLKYLRRRKMTIEDVAYAKKGRLFTLIFSQGFDEKIKCRTWSSVLRDKKSEVSLWNKYLSLTGISKEKEANMNIQEKWFHPLKGSGGLIEILKTKILDMGGEIRLNTSVLKLEHDKKQIQSMKIKTKGKISSLETHTIISSIRIDTMAKLLRMNYNIGPNELSFKRGVIVIYLFFDGPTNFPHTCLYVTDPKKRIGRITNYEAFNCQMVPMGKSCLAFEIFCKNDDPILDLTDEELLTRVKEEFGDAKLIDMENLESTKVYRFPLDDPGTNWEDYKLDQTRGKIYNDLNMIENLYNVSRTGIDKSIYASIKAVESIISNEKDNFIRMTSATELEPWKIKDHAQLNVKRGVGYGARVTGHGSRVISYKW